MSISVIIPIWKRADQLELMLTELDSQAAKLNIALEVILCDSDSGDMINSVVLKHQNKSNNLIILHEHTKNIVAAKRNKGIEKSTGDYLVFLDDDCIPSENFLNDVILLIDNDDGSSVYCGEVRFEADLVKKSNYYRYRDSRHPIYIKSDSKFFNCWTFVTMNFLISKKILKANNIFFNEDFLGYGCEDHAFGWELEKIGIKILFSKQKIYHHEYDGNVTKYSSKIRAIARDGMFIFINEYLDALMTNKKLKTIERFFSRNKILSKLVMYSLFNKFILTVINKLLLITDENKYLYFSPLYRYYFLGIYLEGVLERGKNDRYKLLIDWYK